MKSCGPVTRVLIGLPLLGCDASQALTCGADLSGSEPSTYFGIKTTFPGELPHVLRLNRGARTQNAILDGRPAMLVGSSSAQHLAGADSVGRSLQMNLCLDTAGVGAGDVERCQGKNCDAGELEVRPLVRRTAPTDSMGRTLLESQPITVCRGEEWPSSLVADLAVGSFVVLVRGADGLRVLDFDGQSIEELAHVPTVADDVYNSVKLYRDRFAVVASFDEGLLVFDLDNPNVPTRISSQLISAHASRGHTVFIDGDLAYLARRAPGGSLMQVDLSDPGSPRVLHDWQVPGCDDVHDVHVAASIVTLNCLDFGLIVLRLDGSALEELSRIALPFSHSSWQFELDAKRYVAHAAEDFAQGIQIARIDATTGAHALSSYSLGSAATVHNLACSESSCFVAAYQEGWFELDVTTPSAPSLLRYGHTWNGPGTSFFEGASGIALTSRYVFVADTVAGVLVFER